MLSRSRLLAACTLFAITSAVVAEQPVGAATASAAPLLSSINAARAGAGLPSLAENASLNDLAQRHAVQMTSTRVLAHTANLGATVATVIDWTSVAENVGVGSSVEQVAATFLASPTHRANILGRSFTMVGVGVATGSDGRVWVDELFASTSAPAPAPAIAPVPVLAVAPVGVAPAVAVTPAGHPRRSSYRCVLRYGGRCHRWRRVGYHYRYRHVIRRR